MKLTEVPRPFVCGTIVEATPAAAIARLKLAEHDGARAFELNLAYLQPEYRAPKALAPVFRSTSLPVFTTYRRTGRVELGDTSDALCYDEMRMEAQLRLIDVGSAGLDMELDTFDPVPGPPFSTAEGIRYSLDPSSPPREVSTDPLAAERQMRLIDEAHRRGGEVLASVHCLTRITTEDALRVCRLAETRGADMLKLVRFCHSREDTVETLAQAVALQHQARIPFVIMGTGEYGKLTRLLSPLFGSALCYCRQTYEPGTPIDQPLIRAAVAVLENVDYRIAPRAIKCTADWLRDVQ